VTGRKGGGRSGHVGSGRHGEQCWPDAPMEEGTGIRIGRGASGEEKYKITK
jgi:hypothetical protein